MKSYTYRIWAEDRGFWCEVRDPARRVILTTWSPGTREQAKTEARAAIARDQADRAAETARAA